MAEEIHCKVTVKLLGNEKAFGPGVAALLSGVDTYGSLQGAARSMGMSYSKAWTIIRNAEKIWGFSLTRRIAGGRHGGSSTLTAPARELLRRYDLLRRAAEEAAASQFQRLFSKEEIDDIAAMDRKVADIHET